MIGIMIKVNDSFQELPAVYLFTQISRRLAQYRENPESRELIRMDIGDVPGPLPSCVTQAMHRAVDDLSKGETFRGYGPEQGYLFLRKEISEKDYKEKGIDISTEEIFISDGAKCDLGNLGDIFSKDCKIGVMNPSYPAYIDDNVIDGRAGKFEGGEYTRITYLKCDKDNGYCPELPEGHLDLIYICSPNNPTGTMLPKKELKKWIDFAKEHGSIIIFDSAYESYVRDPEMPRSIYEIKGAKEVAIEVRSFSKTGGFTGIRCGYTVVPKELKGIYGDGKEIQLNSLWSRRQTTKFNGASYVSQKGAEALYSPDGKKAVKEMTDGYLNNAKLLREAFEEAGWEATGGDNSPYVWVKNPIGLSSVEVFEKILNECGVSTTPGSGFGTEGEGYVRLTGFNTKENTLRAIERLREGLGMYKN